MKGKFITFEGGEGTGKSLQSRLLYEYLLSIGKDVMLTREPGGTQLAEEVRKILVTGTPEKIDPITESLLCLASRADHWLHQIEPALNSGKIVVCDRFQDSTVVYQGIGRGVSLALLDSIFKEFTSNNEPNRTYLLDLSSEIGINRSLQNKQNSETRFEKMDIDFHEKVRQGFITLAKKNQDRFLILDASLEQTKIHQIILDDVKNFL